MSRIVRVIVRHVLEIDVDSLIDDCEIGENLDVDTDTLTDDRSSEPCCRILRYGPLYPPVGSRWRAGD